MTERPHPEHIRNLLRFISLHPIPCLTVLLFVGATAALWTLWQWARKDASVARSLRIQQSMVTFLEMINAIPPGISDEGLRKRVLEELRSALEPFRVHVRLWIANQAWKTLRGFGEHPALRPGSSHHLPMTACPAFALRRPFRYNRKEGTSCSSERFNYEQHLCLPIMNERNCFGVLFLGSYDEKEWEEEDVHLFEMLAQAVGLALQRHGLFEKLEEKISDLNFSFEVGAAALATFGGSTRSIEETTVRILDSVLAIMKVDRASLMLWDPQSKVLQTQWVRGGDFKIQSPMRLEIGQGMAGWALQTGEPYWAEYAMGDPHYRPSVQSIRSLLCVPVYTQTHQPVGVINAVTTENARAFLPREIDFLTMFGRQAALAIENARLHQKSRDNIDQLNEVNKLKSQFLSLVSHDLRGPLTGIRGFSEILKQESLGPLTPGQGEMIDQMERQVDLQERMVDDLLDLARMDKSRFSIHPTTTDLIALLHEEVDKSHLEARERHVTLSSVIDIPPSMGLLLIDGGRIRQVLWNLIHNALKFTPEEGRVTVRARLEKEEVRIEVEDSGIGLAAETQARVFDKFFQVSPGGSTSSRGLGLGLTICKEIVLAHQGKITARSPGIGLGTTIGFTLPIQNASAQEQSRPLAA
jgi:signal transduction histidine kinase